MRYCVCVDYSADPKYLALIENELQTGFAFVGAVILESDRENADEAMADALLAYYAAANLLLRIPKSKSLDLHRRLRGLADALDLAKGLRTAVPVMVPPDVRLGSSRSVANPYRN
jgi:hypothetical protein